MSERPTAGSSPVSRTKYARMLKLVDKSVSKTDAIKRVGPSPTLSTRASTSPLLLCLLVVLPFPSIHLKVININKWQKYGVLVQLVRMPACVGYSVVYFEGSTHIQRHTPEVVGSSPIRVASQLRVICETPNSTMNCEFKAENREY